MSPSLRVCALSVFFCRRGVFFKLPGDRAIKRGGFKQNKKMLQKTVAKATERKRGGVCKLKLYYCRTPFLHRGEEEEGRRGETCLEVKKKEG